MGSSRGRLLLWTVQDKKRLKTEAARPLITPTTDANIGPADQDAVQPEQNGNAPQDQQPEDALLDGLDGEAGNNPGDKRSKGRDDSDAEISTESEGEGEKEPKPAAKEDSHPPENQPADAGVSPARALAMLVLAHADLLQADAIANYHTLHIATYSSHRIPSGVTPSFRMWFWLFLVPGHLEVPLKLRFNQHIFLPGVGGKGQP